jgi:hypothetical protein
MHGIEETSSIAQQVVSAQAMEPSTMSISDDVDPDTLISRLARPLAPADREAFRRAAEAALARVPCWGEGAVYRAVAILRDYFVPPSDTRAAWDIEQEPRNNKLTDRPPIGRDYDRRFRHPAGEVSGWRSGRVRGSNPSANRWRGTFSSSPASGLYSPDTRAAPQAQQAR